MVRGTANDTIRYVTYAVDSRITRVLTTQIPTTRIYITSNVLYQALHTGLLYMRDE